MWFWSKQFAQGEVMCYLNTYQTVYHPNTGLDTAKLDDTYQDMFGIIVEWEEE